MIAIKDDGKTKNKKRVKEAGKQRYKHYGI